MDERTKVDNIKAFLDRVGVIVHAAKQGIWTPEHCLLELRMAAHEAKFQTKKAGQ